MGKTYRIISTKVSQFNIRNYVYLIIDQETNKAAIIDPAWELEKIENLVHTYKLDVIAIFLTHSHLDHINLVDQLVEKYNTNVYMSKEEVEFYGFRCANLIQVSDWATIKIGKTQGVTMLTPGHTVGSSCFLLEEDLFTGDTLFIEGCGICSTYGGSAGDMYESIQKIKQYVNRDTQIYPAHSYGKKPGYPLSYLMKNNVYLLIEDKNIFINFRMRKNQKNLFKFC